MTPRWALLSLRDRDAYRLVVAFLSGRMSERGTLDWALLLTRGDAAKRLAVLDAVDSPEGQKLIEPWRSAWRLVAESWDYPVMGDASIEIYHVKQRLHSGDRSGSLIAELVRLVEPRLSVKPLSERTLYGQKKMPSRPKHVGDLMYAGLTSGEAVDPSILEVPTLADRAFLAALASRLEAALGHGLDIGRRIGWDGTRRLWQLGQLHRVYYVPAADRPAGDHEPDRFHRGIAPSTKLLHSIVLLLADVDLSAGLEFARRWRVSESPIHQRLWAAAARDPRLATQAELVDFFGSLNDRLFWNLHDFPEVAELRAKRFGELGTPMQNSLISRIKKRPPRRQWPRQADPERVERGRWFWAGRELRRIEIGGFTLAAEDKAWLDSRLAEFPELAHMNRVDEGFLASAKAYWVAPSPDSRFDSLKGVERLVALEASLSSTQSSVAENPVKGASDWMRQPDNLLQVLSDLESAPGPGSAYPRVWEQFVWSHASSIQQAATESRDLSAEASRVSILLASLSDETVKHAIDGITEWLSTWRKHVVALPDYQALWHRVWPLAVEATNSQQSSADIVDLNTVTRASDDSEPMDLDTLNTPSGKLVGVFLEACPSVTPGSHPFQDDSSLLKMRSAVMNAPGRTSVIVRHRLIEELPYFFAADPTWAREYLVTPLMTETAEALALWRAIARQTQFYDVLEVIGEQMADRAVRRDLGRETRQSLVFSIVVESLWALQAQREPAVPYARVQQMIRSLDDEVRAHAADTIHRFVASVPSSPQGKASSLTPEIIFRNAAAPFLSQVWPQERSLTTPGVSRGFAQLPAVTKDAFAEAVNAIDRFLVPFDCWSMLDYGLYGDEDGSPKLARINTEAEASALLQLLDRTIGASEAAVVPYDLASALDQIQKISAALVESPIFRRLAAAARRTV